MCFVLKEKGKHNLENGKEFPLSLRLGPILFSPTACPPPSPFLLGFGPSTSIRPAQRSPASRARLPSSQQPLIGRSRAPYHCRVGPSGQGRLPPRVRAGHEPNRNPARVSRELSSFRPILALYIPPRRPAIPYLIPSRSRRVKLVEIRR